MSLEATFSKDEFRRILILTYHGEWVVNAEKGKDSLEEYSETRDKMLHYACEIGLEEYVAWDKETGKIQPSFLLESEGRKFIAEYEDKFFLGELADRLSRMDVEALLRSQKD